MLTLFIELSVHSIKKHKLILPHCFIIGNNDITQMSKNKMKAKIKFNWVYLELACLNASFNSLKSNFPPVIFK